MFTGIVEEVGIIRDIRRYSKGAKFLIECNKVLQDSAAGDSICVNGVCLTITAFEQNMFEADVSEETFSVSTFSSLKIGDFVNLERALTLNSRLGGHIVSGHVDCVGQIFKIEKLSDFYNIEIELPSNHMKYVVYKGSVTVNGVSLTIAQVLNNIIKLAIIPHTFENTSFKYINCGQSVNIETDILAKYVEKMISANDNKKESFINEKFLAENGFM